MGIFILGFHCRLHFWMGLEEEDIIIWAFEPPQPSILGFSQSASPELLVLALQLPCQQGC